MKKNEIIATIITNFNQQRASLTNKLLEMNYSDSYAMDLRTEIKGEISNIDNQVSMLLNQMDLEL